jgi:hypothetical protein
LRTPAADVLWITVEDDPQGVTSVPSVDEHARSQALLSALGVSTVTIGKGLDALEQRGVAAADLRTWFPRSDPRWEQAAARLRDMTQDDDRQRGLIPT